MTLGRQLLLLTTLMFVLIFSGTFVISINNTRDYLQTQLQSHAQDAASSLGLSLSPHMAAKDEVIMQSMVDAIFDGGYYREISLIDIDGKPIVERRHEIKVEGVPAWFIKSLPLETPTAEAGIMDGWKQGGVVRVRSHPGYAYKELWSSARETLWWSLGSLVLALLGAGLLLRFILTPLRAVEEQAEAIAARDFRTQERIPWTRELRRVVLVMNRMSAKVREMFQEQSELAEHLRQQAYSDPLTGVANRRNLEMRLEQMTHQEDETSSGALVLLRVAELEKTNKEFGYAAGDELMRSLAERLESLVGQRPDLLLARVGGAEFAILAPNVTQEEADELAQASVKAAGQISPAGTKPVVSHAGVSYYHGSQSAKELMSEADMALRRAEGSGVNAWFRYTPEEGEKRVEVHGVQGWRKMLDEVLAERKVFFHFQSVRSCKDYPSIMHYELFTRVKGRDGCLIPAGVFLPMAERTGRIVEYDRLVVERFLEGLRFATRSDTRYVINLSPTSVGDEAFAEWLCAKVEGVSELAPRLIFEVTEQGALRDLPSLGQLINWLSPLGVGFSLDRFGVSASSFGYLQDLKLNYLKPDGSFMRGVDSNRESQFFLRVLTDIAHSLEIKIIANFVETKEEFTTVKVLGMDGVQGYYVEKPKAQDELLK